MEMVIKILCSMCVLMTGFDHDHLCLFGTVHNWHVLNRRKTAYKEKPMIFLENDGGSFMLCKL